MNKIIYYVEGEKTEPNFIFKLYRDILKYENCKIMLDTTSEYKINLNDEIEIYIKWIPEADIKKFLNFVAQNQEIQEGISISNYFGIPTEYFSEEYVLIDYDLHGSIEKKSIILELNNIISRISNTFLILNSPMMEACVDDRVEISLSECKGRKYKRHIGETYSGGYLNYFIKNLKECIYLNENKLETENNDEQIKEIVYYKEGTDLVKICSLIVTIFKVHFLTQNLETICNKLEI